MIDTPASSRLHIVLLGERNSGKSSLLNALAGQSLSIVSDIPGTTTDRVSKAIEIIGLGPCLFVDTAGLDDGGELGSKRVRDALDAAGSADIVMAVIDASTGRLPDLPENEAVVLTVLNKCDLVKSNDLEEISAAIEKKYGSTPIQTSAVCREGVDEIVSALKQSVPQDWDAAPLTAGVIADGQMAVLVMPQDNEAPKGRLILPQQQVIRELLDRGCRVVCCTTGHIASTLSSLSEAPAVVITDSRDFAAVHSSLPEGVRITSFSILMAAAKGDINYFMESVKAIDSLTSSSRVLIAEACAHVPATEDIGRVKIPGLLRSRAGENLRIDIVSGRNFPRSLEGYDLVIHCGACMFNRRYVLARVRQAKDQKVPMTNYGIAIAYINNLL